MARRSRKNTKSPLDAARDTAAQAKALDALGPLEGLDAESIVERYQGLCIGIVEQLRGVFSLSRRHSEDMLADANLGLMEAWSRFDAAHGGAFSTFAYYRVKGAVIDGLRSRGTVQRRSRARASIAAAAQDCAQSGPTARPTQQDRLRNLDSTLRAMSAAALLAYTAEAEAAETESRARRSPAAALIHAQTRERLRDGMATLPDLDRHVLEGLYFKGVTLRELAAEAGRSRSWMCRVHTRALRTLQDWMRRTGDGPGG